MPELPRALRMAGLGVLILFVLAAPLLLPSYPLFVLSLGLVYTVAILGVNLVMGYAGQVSLGHAGFAAIGAYATALLITDAGFSYWAALPIGGLLAGAFGYLLGFPALRLGPLYVAMVTFGFGLVVMLVAQNWYELTNGPNGIVLMPPTLFGRTLLAPEFHYVVAVVTIGMYVLARNIVHSAKGRAFMAIRESELAAQAMGVHLAHYKTMAFALGAFYAGISGGLFAGLAQFVNPDAFVFMVSILYVTMGILGGMGYLAGPAIGGITMAAVPELLRGSAEYKDFLTGLLLLLLLIFLPRGLTGLLAKLRRTGVAEAMQAPKVDLAPFDEPRTQSGPTLLEVDGLTIRFGGLTALSDVSFSVNSGEILGLIGPNGAGKTTLFNLVSGVYRPTAGRILYQGQDISRLPPHRRTDLRIARTFQNLELFEEMTVLENVLVGAHSTVSVTLASAAVRRDRAAEADVRARALTLLGYVGLARYAELPANSLPFGHQRLLEIARALAVRPRLLMLDEPSAGLSTAEMDFLMDVIRRIRADLGVTVVVIGHTMRLVMSLSDRIVVLDHGEKIAEGDPATVRGDRNVIQAYLGAAHA